MTVPRCGPSTGSDWDSGLTWYEKTSAASPVQQRKSLITATGPRREKALELLGSRAMMRLRDFATYGIAPETLARLVREGALVRPARGLYQLADRPVDARRALAEAATLVPKGVICLVSALQFHGLTLQMPSSVWMAIGRTAWRPRIDYPPIRFVRFTPAALGEGVGRHDIEGVAVAITDPARTIVDGFRYRASIGVDVALEGPREGLRQGKATTDQLWRYGSGARIWSVMKPYVEATAASQAILSGGDNTGGREGHARIDPRSARRRRAAPRWPGGGCRR